MIPSKAALFRLTTVEVVLNSNVIGDLYRHVEEILEAVCRTCTVAPQPLLAQLSVPRHHKLTLKKCGVISNKALFRLITVIRGAKREC